jgi:cell division protein FtsB
MVVLTEIRRRARLVVGPVLGISLVGYFAYHLVQGDRGLVAWLSLTQQIKEAKLQVAKLGAERQLLDSHVSLLRPNHLDRDMLDERARATLNLIGPHEVVIFNDSLPR